MRDDEHLASLLGVARDSLRTELQPGLDPVQRYRAAMIAGAMAIAARALSTGADSRSRQLLTLQALYPDHAGESLPRLERRLASELRRAKLDVEREERVRAALLARTLARLEITNPDYPASFARPQAV